MKKYLFILTITILLVSFSACNKKVTNNESTAGTATPSPSPIVTLTPVKVTDDVDTSGTQAQQNTDTYTLQDYYPIQADAEYIYEGSGNEYASYTVFNDFIDADNNQVQTRTNNGGTETVRVVQIKDGKITVIYKLNECYYRDSFLNKSIADKDAEVLLMEPLIKGTEWTLPDGSSRYISETNVDIDTPSGKYKALEVTTEGKDSITKDYYAPKVGLVKTVFNSGSSEVSSTLGDIKTNTPFTQQIEIYYPDVDEKLHTETLTLSFRTGETFGNVLEKTLHEQAVKESYLPLISSNTKINNLYLGDDKVVYVDFSSNLVKDMNAGTGYEALILQGITNTLGNYYSTDKVSITLDGKPYESGHIVMEKGETFKVNMENVIR